MDTARLTLSALLAVCCTGGLAQSETGWYLGTGLVAPKPRPDLRISPLPGEPREAAEPYARQFGGYRFTRHWSVDFGYAGSAQSNAWTLAGSGLLPIGRSFSLRGRLGLAMPTAEFSVSSAAGAFSSLAGMDSRVRSNLLWGFGGEYEINRNVGLRMDYNSRYGEDAAYNRARTDLWSINAVVRF